MWLIIFWCNYSYAANGITYDNNLTTRTDLDWNSFEYWTITIEYDWKSITMMDRNLWATTNDIDSTGSYGYIFQWWNNYWFERGSYEVTSWALMLGSDTSWVIWNSIYNNSGYYGTSFINNNSHPFGYWSDHQKHNDLWWWWNDNTGNDWWYPVINSTDRHWPCPEWYHVPSAWERSQLVGRWILSSDTWLREQWFKSEIRSNGFFNAISDHGWSNAFRRDFNIPLASTYGDDGFLRTSTAIEHIDAPISYQLNWGGPFSYHVNWYSVEPYNYVWASAGNGVRCFKNPDNIISWNNSTINEDISFSISIGDTTKVWKTEFVVKVMEDWAIYTDYTGTVHFYLTDKYWNTIDSNLYAFSDGKSYKFSKSDRWKKTFSVKIEEEWTYVIKLYDSSNDNIKWSETITVKWNSSNSNFEFDTLRFNPYYSDEMNMAYQYAYYYWITTISNIRDADMNGWLTRIAMAKMLSYFAENVLWMDDFDTTRNCYFNDVPSYLDRQYNYWVTKACQLGIMWINMQNNNFNPYWTVTRAQFATALSRLLYWTKDWTDKYYSTHISKLYREWIISNTDPTLKEKRWYVMLMLMRSDKDYVPEEIDYTSTHTYSVNKIDTTVRNIYTEWCDWTTQKLNDYNTYHDMPNKNWIDDAKFVNKALQDVRDNGQYLVKNYIDEANRVLDSAWLTKRDQCRYSLLIDELENQKWYIKSYKTENGKTTVWIDFLSYKENISWDDYTPNGSRDLLKNTSTKLRNYTLSSNVELEILNVDRNWYTNERTSKDRKYISNRNTRLNSFCNYEPVYNWEEISLYSDGEMIEINRNEHGNLCTKNMIIGNEGYISLLNFRFDATWTIDRISWLNYRLVNAG